MDIYESRKTLRRSANQVLKQPIGQSTNWVIFSGPPGSGKTTTAEYLREQGFSIAADISRQHLANLIVGKEKRKHVIRRNQVDLQKDILWKMILSADSQDRDAQVIFDYGLPDNIAFWSMESLPMISAMWRSSLLFRYKHVFMFEKLPLKSDSIRTENEPFQIRITTELMRVYQALGYAFTWIPCMSLDLRAHFILEKLGELHGSGDPS